ncbi:MAG TPA: MliC family protein [Spirochaetia bacterium]|nr:MliC family protein [Spirochaetia bacterium]
MKRTIHIATLSVLPYLFLSCATSLAGNPVTKVTYACDNGVTIEASYYADRRVTLNLSDGRSYSLAQVISADGARYANTDESFVFWSKGQGATLIEKSAAGGQQTRIGCILVKPDPGGCPNIFADSSRGFSLRYPDGWKIDQSYVYTELGPGKEIKGVSFSIPEKLCTGTNLAPDTRLSIEMIPFPPAWGAEIFLPESDTDPTPVTQDGVTYSRASYSDAGAGNRYDEVVYAIPGSEPFTAVRYFIHSGAIENYSPGTVRQFDKAALRAVFDAMRRTLTIDQMNVPRQ